MPWLSDYAAHGYSRRGNFGGSVFRRVLWLNDTSYRKSVRRSKQEVPSWEHNGTSYLAVLCLPIAASALSKSSWWASARDNHQPGHTTLQSDDLRHQRFWCRSSSLLERFTGLLNFI